MPFLPPNQQHQSTEGIQRYFRGCEILICVTWSWPRPFHWWLVISRLGLAAINLQTKFEVSNYPHYEDMKSSAKCTNFKSLDLCFRCVHYQMKQNTQKMRQKLATNETWQRRQGHNTRHVTWSPLSTGRATKAHPHRAAWCISLLHTQAHTCTSNSPSSRTTRVSRYQKGKTSLDFTEAR